MTRDEWTHWLEAQNWPQVHRDQVRRQAERCIDHLHAETQRLEAELDQLRDQLEARQSCLAVPTPVAREQIVKAVEHDYGVKFAQLTSRRRPAGLIRARQALCFLIRELLETPFEEIGRFMNRDHSSVIYGCNTVRAAIEARTLQGARVVKLLTALRGDSPAFPDFAKRPDPAGPDKITEHVVREFGVTADAIRSGRRARPVANARHVLCWLMHEVHGETLRWIGVEVGGRSHTTVADSCKLVEEAVSKNTALGKRARRVRALLESQIAMQEAS
jgi:chromosomal replication initiation ATPase DnaA